MNGIQIKDIPGALVGHEEDYPNNVQYDYGFKEAITQQGQVKITLSRDNLIKIINEALFKRNELKDKMFENVAKRPKLPLLQEYIADTIIANQKDLFEVVK